MVWVVLVFLLVVAGALVWAVRTGNLPPELQRCQIWWFEAGRPKLRRCLSWWFEVDERPLVFERPVDAPDDEAEEERAQTQDQPAPASFRSAPRPVRTVVPPVEPPAARTAPPPAEPRPVRSAPPAAVRPVARPAAPAAAVAREEVRLPVIGLADMAQNMQQRAYRSHPSRPAPASPAPVLDADAIRDNVLRRMPHAGIHARPQAPLPVITPEDLKQPVKPGEARARAQQSPARVLPVIGAEEVEQNLLPKTPRIRTAQVTPRPLPVIPSAEVRASLQEIHGNRLKPRSTVRVEPAAPARPTPPVLSMPKPAPKPAQPRPPVPEPRPAPPLPTSGFLPAVREAPDVALPVAPSHPAGDEPRVPVVRVEPVPVRPVGARQQAASLWPVAASEEDKPFVPVVTPTPVVLPAVTPATAIVPAVSAASAVPATAAAPTLAPMSSMAPAPLVAPAPTVAPAPLPFAFAAPMPVAAAQPVFMARPAPVAAPVPAVTAAAVVPPAASPLAASLTWHSIEERAPEAPAPVVMDRPASINPAPVERVATPRPVYAADCLPGLDLLMPAEPWQEAGVSEEALLERGIVIEEKLAEFKVKVSVIDAYAGPVITRYEVDPAVGVRGSQVVNLIKDLARALGLASIRVVETIPGKTCMGLELPNPVRQMIRLSEILSSDEFTEPSPKLTLALGKDITGQPVVMDLARAPHMLVAGTTGSGKSVGVNAMILSLLYKFTPNDVRFIMIDPKMLELSVYNDIPHLLAPVVTDMKLAANALNWCVGEMEKRYRLMSALGVRNLAGYNEKVSAAAVCGATLKNPFSLTPDDPEALDVLPAIVVVVDEFADLMMVAGKKIEELIARLAQKARAAGIHLILATQRPSVDVITGLIKANIPTRIAFQVSSKIDSRTILDQMGAEALLGQGDMLYLPPGSGYPQRIHGAFVTDDEVHSVVEHLKRFGEPDYIEGLLTGESELEEDASSGSSRASAAEADPLYDEAVEIVMRTRKASISSVQRHLRIGYNRAARLIEEMEAAGLVSSMENNGNRTVLVPQRDA